jgi:hypothetical protein
MNRPRLLIPISLQFSVRYLLRTGLLSLLKDFAAPVILLGWEDKKLEQELRHEGYEVHALLKARWGAQYERTRTVANLWHENRLNSPTTAIRERRANLDRTLSLRLQKKLRRSIRGVVLAAGGARRIQRRESELFWSDTNARAVEAQLKKLKIDAVFCLTPFLVDEEMTVRVAVLSGVPSCTAILSFDNLTTRPWMPITFDQYLLWNGYNAEQLRRGYPQTAEREVTIVGSPQFDFYWKPEYLWDEQHWRQRLTLPPDRPVLLLAGGYFSCAPHEPQFLGQLDEAIEAKEIPGNPIILFRRHPVDPLERWQGVLKRAKHVILDNPWELGRKTLGHTNISHDDIRRLVSTLYYSAVHVNVASTMTVDGAIFDRYQVGPAYDDSPSRKYDRAAIECYHQEHYIPVTSSGGVDIARNREHLIRAVGTGFTNPENMREGRRRLVKEVCTFNDGKCSQRVATAVRAFLETSVARSRVAIAS